jgi:hypothetical protein
VPLTVTAAELRERSDAAAIVNDRFRTAGGRQAPDIMLILVTVTFSDQVRCGEGSGAGYAIVWMGSCGIAPSAGTMRFGQGSTFVIAHELIHVLGAVAPCAPHYGNNGHVTDDPRDLLYNGPARRDPNTVLDPGHDDYYGTGRSDCPDVANHPAWKHNKA